MHGLIVVAAPAVQDLTNRLVRKGSATEALKRVTNRAKSKVRAHVEHVFAVVKRLWQFGKVRLPRLGRERNARVCAHNIDPSIPRAVFPRAVVSTGMSAPACKCPQHIHGARGVQPELQPRILRGLASLVFDLTTFNFAPTGTCATLPYRFGPQIVIHHAPQAPSLTALSRADLELNASLINKS
mgnify:CR=1 FL=1